MRSLDVKCEFTVHFLGLKDEFEPAAYKPGIYRVEG